MALSKCAVTKTFVTPLFFSMAPADKKRPRGLKGVAAQKAAKKAKTDKDEEQTQTVILDKEVEEGDELGEVAALYESAKEKHGTPRFSSVNYSYRMILTQSFN
jgi:hypothetical protein